MLIRIATRKSALALWQAEHVAERLQALDEVDSVELVPLSTRGDEILDRSLQKIGGKGLFIKELEVAMQAGDADIAVHSMKDVPVDLPPGLHLGVILQREDPRDAFLSPHGLRLADLPRGAAVHQQQRRFVVGYVGVHRADHGDVVDRFDGAYAAVFGQLARAHLDGTAQVFAINSAGTTAGGIANAEITVVGWVSETPKAKKAACQRPAMKLRRLIFDSEFINLI